MIFLDNKRFSMTFGVVIACDIRLEQTIQRIKMNSTKVLFPTASKPTVVVDDLAPCLLRYYLIRPARHVINTVVVVVDC